MMYCFCLFNIVRKKISMFKRKLLLFILPVFCLIGADNPVNLIYHDNDYLLRWKDFKGTPEGGYESYSAMSYVGFRMGYKGTAKMDSLQFVVEAFFNPDRSWRRVDTSAHLLEHEQIHFDIAELYTRKLKEQLSLATLQYSNYQSTVKTLEGTIRKDMNRADSLYDADTDNSMNREKQQLWRKNIAEDLARLKTFTPDTFALPVKF